MDYLPEVYLHFKDTYPDVMDKYSDLAKSCHDWGPLDQKIRRLIKLGIALGRNSEGAVKSQTRKALSEGIDPNEIRHAVVLGLTTAGFPTMIAATKWVEDVIKQNK